MRPFEWVLFASCLASAALCIASTEQAWCAAPALMAGVMGRVLSEDP